MDKSAQHERYVMETFSRRRFAVTQPDFSRLNIRKTESADIGLTGQIRRGQLAEGRRENG